MLFTVASALVYVENRQLVEVFPESVRKVWKDQELRVALLFSLFLQIVLIALGNLRKHNPRTRIRVILWCAYLLADWVATVSLGVISKNAQDDYECGKKNPNDDKHNELISFWAPFLLLHLGGPDTITAYALEDNQLWLRHLAGLLIQTSVAFYTFLLAWPGDTWLPYLSIPMFVAGLIKYFERTLALRSANSDHLRDSMLTDPDPGPNYAKFMDEYTLKKAEGYHVKADEVIEASVPTQHSYPDGRGKLISEAFDFFQTFKRLFVDLILTFQDQESSQSYFQELKSSDAFHVIEVELGFAFDVLYTKAPVAHTLVGLILRLISFTLTLTVLLAYWFLCDKNHYPTIDLTITYLLLAVAVILEVYAFIVLLRSDWTDNWLSKQNKTRKCLIVSCLRQPNKKWWSNSMAQYNLLSICLKEKPAVWTRIQRLLDIDQLRQKHRYKTYRKVSDHLKELIFDHFNEFAHRTPDPKALCTHRGSFALKENNYRSLEWTTKVDFDQEILIWHIATDICYYLDVELRNTVSVSSPKTPTASIRDRERSKDLSDYMLYLLVMCPAMLPIGIGMIRFRDTCAEAMRFFEERSTINSKINACKKLLEVSTEVLPLKVKGDRSKSVLFDACRLAKSLQAIAKENKWRVVSRVWVEMLAYAATHCRGNQHAQQLRKGGELLTHVWLLMAHLGITEQIQISQGHARAKLIVS